MNNRRKFPNQGFSRRPQKSLHLQASPSSLDEQREILSKTFREVGILQPNPSFLSSYKIPKQKMNFNYASLFSPEALQKSIVKCTPVGPHLVYNLPPDLHWSLIFGWPWPRPLLRSEEGTASFSSTSHETQQIIPADPVVEIVKPTDWKQQLTPYANQKENDKEKRSKPRFRFDSDRNHDFSDDEDVSTIPSKIKSIQSSRVESDSGNGPSPDTSEEDYRASQTESQKCYLNGNMSDEGIAEDYSPEKKLVFKIRFNLKAQAIVSSEFRREQVNIVQNPTEVEEGVTEPSKSVVVYHEDDGIYQDLNLFGAECSDDEDILTISIEETEREF